MSDPLLPGGPLGGRHPRPDAGGKVTGSARYVADLALPGMLHGALVVARVPAARLLGLDVTAARGADEVEAVLTAADVPGANRIGVIFPDQPLLVEDRVRMVGDRLALVAARTATAAWRAAALVEARLEPLPSVHDPVAACAAAAPPVHEGGNLVHTFRVARGATPRFDGDTVVVEAEYRIGGQEHAYLEPQGCLVTVEGRQRVTVTASCQCPFYVQQGVARVLGLPLAAVRVEQAPTGGGFGGKEDYPSEVAACAALLAWHTGRPVRLVYPRELDMQVSTKRHAAVVRHRWGAGPDGRLRFAEVETFLDAGAYAGLSTVVAERSNVSAIGPYHVPSVRVATHVVYTNNLLGGAFRGFGAPQVTVAAEATMDRLARALGLDPVEVRRRNLLDDRRRVTCTGQRLRRPVLAGACLERAAELAGWVRLRGTPRVEGPWRRGVGVGLVMYGCNLHKGGQRLDRSSAVVILQPDGSVVVRMGITEMGQGTLVAVQTIAAQALGVDPGVVEVWMPDTTTVADSGPTVASRGAQMAGMAVLDAVARLRRRLDPVAAELLGCEPAEVRLGGGRATAADGRSVPLAEVARTMVERRVETLASGWHRTRERRFDAETGLGSPYEFYAFACHVARVGVDADLGTVRVEDVWAVHDVGRVIHQAALEGQVEGGVVQAMGWALSEQLVLESGRLANPSFTDYVIPTAADAPRVSVALVEADAKAGPFGAKGIGEPSFIPTAAAIRGAVCDALDVELDRLPFTAPEVVSALGARHRFAWLVEDPAEVPAARAASSP